MSQPGGVRPTLNLSRCSRGKGIVAKSSSKSRAKKCSSSRRKQKRQNDEDWKLPIPSFRNNFEQNRKRERELLGEEAVEEEPKITKLPIPEFQWDDFEESDDDEFLRSLPSFQRALKIEARGAKISKVNKPCSESNVETDNTISFDQVEEESSHSKTDLARGNLKDTREASNDRVSESTITDTLMRSSNKNDQISEKRSAYGLSQQGRALPLCKIEEIAGKDITHDGEGGQRIQGANKSEYEDVVDNTSLFKKVDEIFVRSDKENMTVKMVYRELAKQFGSGLTRGTKLQVRSRLKDLVNGIQQPCLVPEDLDKTRTNGDSGQQDKKTIEEFKRPESSSLEEGNQFAKNRGVYKSSSETKKLLYSEGGEQSRTGEIEVVKETNREKGPPKETFGVASEATAKSTCEPTNTSKGLASTKEQPKRNPSETIPSLVSKSLPRIDEANHVSAVVESGNPHGSGADSESSIQRQSIKTNCENESSSERKSQSKVKIPSRSKKKKVEDTVFSMEVESDEGTNSMTLSISNRKRGRPPKATIEKIAEQDKKVATKATPKLGAAQTRKRARKRACALCTTCPCQNKQKDGAIFARSDAAVEKVLIRRIQKLEKLTEDWEERTEVAKRKLKQHRREIWKKKEKKLTAKNISGGGWQFLPDAEVFEAQETESRKLPKGVVREAQKKSFAEVRDIQSTLIHWIGGRSTGGKQGESDKNDAIDERQLISHDEAIDCASGNELENTSEKPSDTEEEVNKEYVKERQHDDQVHRVKWERSGENLSLKRRGMQSITAWSVLTDIPEMDDKNDDDDSFCVPILSQNRTTSFECPWDRLFSDSQGVEEEELEHLFGLFEASQIASSQSVSNGESGAITAPPQSAISLSMLSQGGQNSVNDIQSEIFGDKKKMSALNRVCPDWRENVSFAFFQKDASVLSEALINVRKSKQQMEGKKRKILEAWERQQLTLDVFERALTLSLGRLEANISTIQI